jgi:TerC family integral membrane protein
MQIAVSTLAWIGFCVFILVMLAIDLGVFNRRPHEITYKDAAIWSAVWVALALVFAGLLFGPLGWEMFGDARHQKALEFLTGYLIELSLSVDNLFVFVLIFSYFKVPPKYQHRVLFWGVLGALVMRVIMIVAGTELIERFHWIIYVFGAFLIYTGIKMFSTQDEKIDPENRFVVKFVTRYVPIVRHYERRKFFTVVIVVEFTDLVFALDSIPAIFGVTTDRFIVYTSNVFAILGLRTFYFLLSGVIERFHYLKYGLGIVLGFIGVKMLLPIIAKALGAALTAIGFVSMGAWVKARTGIPTHIALGIVAVVLISSVLISLVTSKPASKNV